MSEFQANKKNFFLREMFPRQFDTVPHTVIWALVFILDVVAVFYAAHLMGFLILSAANKAVLMIYLIVAFGLFCLESYIYNIIRQ